jgi:hypothetical protein
VSTRPGLIKFVESQQFIILFPLPEKEINEVGFSISHINSHVYISNDPDQIAKCAMDSISRLSYALVVFHGLLKVLRIWMGRELIGELGMLVGSLQQLVYQCQGETSPPT